MIHNDSQSVDNHLQQFTIHLQSYYNPFTIHLQPFTIHIRSIYNHLSTVIYNPFTRSIYNELQPITIAPGNITASMSILPTSWSSLLLPWHTVAHLS